MKPLVSCILATSNRRNFLSQAVSYFLKQTYGPKELIVVDDSRESAADLIPNDPRITYLKLDAQMNLGQKLNLGIAEAAGQIIQKLDDDDYYHPDFLTATTGALLGHDASRVIVGFDCFLVLIAATGEVKFSGYGWCAGGTLCFYQQLWERIPFRDVPRAVDWWFLQDHEARRLKIDNPELYILVRHNAGHVWTRLGDVDVTDYFQRRASYSKSLRELLSDEDWGFYESLKREQSGRIGLPSFLEEAR